MDYLEKMKWLNTLQAIDDVQFEQNKELYRPMQVVGGGLSSETLGEAYPDGDKIRYIDSVLLPSLKNIGIDTPQKLETEAGAVLDSGAVHRSNDYFIDSDPESKERLIKKLMIDPERIGRRKI